MSRDPTAIEDLAKLGFQATPVVVVDGKAVVGFQESKLKQLLSLA